MSSSMEISRVGWLPEMGMEDDLSFNSVELLDDLSPQEFAAMFEEFSSFNPTYLDPTIITSSSLQLEPQSQTYAETPPKIVKTPAAGILSFDDPKPEASHSDHNGSSLDFVKPKTVAGDVTRNYTPRAGRGNKRSSTHITESPCCTKDHVISERKRRAKLSQQFIALSAIVPGLKKMDKASILGDSMNYLKHLQEKVKILEEQNSKKTMESAVYVKKSQVITGDESSSSDSDETETLPHIEARVSDSYVLIRIHSEKQKGILVNALEETEKLNLSVVNSSVMPFGTSTLDITIMAQMEEEFNMTVGDLVRKLRSSFIDFLRKSLPQDKEQE